jgi:hypothetical protein
LIAKRKKPPPDNPGNLAGRKLQRRAVAWARACGGVQIHVGKEGERVDSHRMRGTYKAPDDVAERFKAELVKVEAAWAKRRKAAPTKPKPMAPEDTEGVELVEFLLS